MFLPLFSTNHSLIGSSLAHDLLLEHYGDGGTMSKKGILIAVEGMDGSGKSTQAKLLYHWLRAKGLPVFHTEWNSSKIVKQATKIGKNTRRLLPITFHMIHACLLYTSPSPRDGLLSRMPSSA